MRRRWPGSIAGRLAGLFALLSLGVFGLSAVVLYRDLKVEMAHERQHAQRTKLELVVQMIDRVRDGGPVSAHWPAIAQELEVLHHSDRSTRFWVFCEEGSPQGCSQDWTESPRQVFSQELRGLPPGHRVRVVLGSEEGRMQDTLQRFAWLIGVVSLSGALALALLGGALVRWALWPVRQLSEATRTLGPDQLSQRLAVPDAASELHVLVQAFNGALDRMEQAFVQLETFNANVAHELRSPLSTLIGSTQVALARPREVDELQEVLAGNLEDAERLAAMVRDMLFLARADHGARADALQWVDLRALVAETAEFFEPLLEDEGRRLVQDVPERDAVLAHVNPGLLKRALSNLIANALQYGDPGEPIVIALAAEPAAVRQCRLDVVNAGPPLDEATRARMFDRFYRADVSRGREGGHAGLGLAIVKAVATMHGGSVHVRCHAPGRVCIGLSLPLAGTARAAVTAA
ncbi:heavy metal sensor histidine kinase [Sphaerotilus sp.]|uniref:heavy metal sensor histidine kinase n=1 Tax=Sphaerotilus sp. TaxID=2093942 RepID=UPI0034E28F01